MGELPGKNKACLCGSGKKFKSCCLPRQFVFFFDHPALPAVWNVLAVDEEQAAVGFAGAWLQNGLSASGLEFERGRIYLDVSQGGLRPGDLCECGSDRAWSPATLKCTACDRYHRRPAGGASALELAPDGAALRAAGPG